MRKISLCCMLFLAMPYLGSSCRAQSDLMPAVLIILPERSGSYTPRFSPFCSDRVWLGGQAFDLPTRRFLRRDSSLSCLPAAAIRRQYGTDLNDSLFLWWESDPYANAFYWAQEYRHDTLVLWRYDVQQARQDSFSSLLGGTEVAFGKPGIWVTNHHELILHDRHSGQALNRIRNKAHNGTLMGLTPWGNDVIITERRRLYKRDQNTFGQFFPLPSDLKGCQSPEELEFKGEIRGSRVREENSGYTYYLTAPDQKPVRLPFDWGCCASDYILAVNPPFVWFRLPEKLMMSIHRMRAI